MTLYSKPVIYVVISLLVLVVIYSSTLTFDLSALMKRINEISCDSLTPAQDDVWEDICCWTERDDETSEEQISCCGTKRDNKQVECWDTPTTSVPPTSGDTILPGGGVAEDPTPPTPPLTPRGTPPLGEIAPEAEQPPTPPQPTPRTPGQSVLPQDEGVLEQPTDEGTGGAAPRIVEPPPPTCAPGTVLDPDINECVLENPPELCPDGSIPQPTGPGGTQPECPPFEAEEPQAAEEPEQSESQEQDEAQPEEEQPSEEDSSEDNNSDN
ncbi:MAG: hypothetical protein ACRD8W_12220 [Nitrososphaeraceae archaeon]